VNSNDRSADGQVACVDIETMYACQAVQSIDGYSIKSLLNTVGNLRHGEAVVTMGHASSCYTHCDLALATEINVVTPMSASNYHHQSV
jgi:hypothetical protein